MADDYESMTVAQLKDLLKEQGLPVSGKKADLIERLAGAAEEDDAPVEETEASSDAEESDDDFFEEDDDWDDDEDEGHVAKQKPVLDEATQEALALRAAQKKKTPSFRRTEWFRYKRLSRSGWRAPHGMDNKRYKETTSSSTTTSERKFHDPQTSCLVLMSKSATRLRLLYQESTKRTLVKPQQTLSVVQRSRSETDVFSKTGFTVSARSDERWQTIMKV